MTEDHISLNEAAELAGVSPSTLKRWTREKVIPVDDGRWTRAAAAQAIRRVADAEVRLFHLYVHEPLIRGGVPPLEMAEEMQGLAGDLLPVTAPLMEYMHNRYLRFYTEQDVVGHMESDLGGGGGLA